MKFIVLLTASYLLGAVPFGLLIAGAFGIDLRKIGSGNIGATNLARALGKKWAYFCFVLDFSKGLLPTIVAGLWLNDTQKVMALWAQLTIGCAAVIGHVFSVYLRFKGGKGVATSFGVAVGVWPYYTVCAVIVMLVWVIVLLIWRYVSLASLVASVAFPLVFIAAVSMIPEWEMNTLWPLLMVAVLIPLLVFTRHRENISRLMAGTENKVFQKKT